MSEKPKFDISKLYRELVFRVKKVKVKKSHVVLAGTIVSVVVGAIIGAFLFKKKGSKKKEEKSQ